MELHEQRAAALSLDCKVRIRDSVLRALLDGELPLQGPIQTLAQLLRAEERLDELEGLGADSRCEEYTRVRQLAQEFVVGHPELLETPWLRCAGAVHDMLAAMPRRAPE